MNTDNNAKSTDVENKTYTKMFDEAYNTGVDDCIEMLSIAAEQYDGLDEPLRIFVLSLSNQLQQLKKQTQ